jgi:polygalacturonase
MVQQVQTCAISARSNFARGVLLAGFGLWLAVSPVLARVNGVYNIRDFGAVGDGATMDTQAIQKAIDTCSGAGGGTVLLPAGSYLSGTIYLKNQVTLHIDTGATLLGSTEVADYPLNTCEFPSYSDSYVGRALLWGEGLHQVSISGNGTIDGQGAKFRHNKPEQSDWQRLVSFYQDKTRYVPEARYINRPYLIRLISCSDVIVEGVTLRNAPMWMQHYLNCDFVRIQNIQVYNHGSGNNDMIDIDCSRNVIITGCYGDSDDDAITLKSTAAVPTENVTIANCIVSSFCNAIKMGTESSGGFKNIAISNCVIRPSGEPELIYGRREGLAGIALEIVDGGSLERVTISNIAIRGTTAPIFMRLGNRARPHKPGLTAPPAGTFRDVILSNITATEASGTGCSITGIPGHRIENVTLSNVKINFQGGGSKDQVDVEVPENVTNYPESTMFGTLPAYGLYCRHVDGLTLRDFTLAYGETDNRPALVCDDVRNLNIDSFAADAEPQVLAQLIFKNTVDAMVTNCRPPVLEVFLRVEDNSNGISLMNNDFSRVKTPFVVLPAVPEKAIYAENNRIGQTD